jgi:hypothetical protein
VLFHLIAAHYQQNVVKFSNKETKTQNTIKLIYKIDKSKNSRNNRTNRVIRVKLILFLLGAIIIKIINHRIKEIQIL